jgi:drug/metabolite transporter (DMT)-like permease
VSTKQSPLIKGYAFALFAALMWGVSGTLSQFLIQKRNLTPEWLVTVRLFVSSIMIFLLPLVKNPKSIFAPWANRRDCFELLCFGIFGMLAVQYTFTLAILYSNAATATIIQYLGPVLIACYYSIRFKRLPRPNEQGAIILALIGTFLIVTHGSTESISINSDALFWGLCSAFALAIYSIVPIRLINKYDASVIVGWGLLIGGIAFSFFTSPFDVPGEWDVYTYSFIAATVILGTSVAFYLYLVSVKIVGPTVASVLACAEPLSAAIIGVLWLKTPFGFYDWVGSFCIILTIFLLAKESK